MRFLGTKFTQNALAACRTPPQTPLAELKRSPRPFADFRGPLRGRGKGKEGKEGGEKWEKGYWGRERGREGKGRGKGGKGEGGWKGRGGRDCVIGVRGDRRPSALAIVNDSERYAVMSHYICSAFTIAHYRSAAHSRNTL